MARPSIRDERPVPRWSSSTTRWAFSAVLHHPEPGIGRGPMPPGPPWRNRSNGRSSAALAGSTISRANTSIDPNRAGSAQSTGTWTTWSVTTKPVIA